jgi:hypothetical protein
MISISSSTQPTNSTIVRYWVRRCSSNFRLLLTSLVTVISASARALVTGAATSFITASSRIMATMLSTRCPITTTTPIELLGAHVGDEAWIAVVWCTAWIMRWMRGPSVRFQIVPLLIQESDHGSQNFCVCGSSDLSHVMILKF